MRMVPLTVWPVAVDGAHGHSVSGGDRTGIQVLVEQILFDEPVDGVAQSRAAARGEVSTVSGRTAPISSSRVALRAAATADWLNRGRLLARVSR